MLHLACETALAHSYFCMDRTSTISGSGRRGLAGNKTRRGGWRQVEARGGAEEGKVSVSRESPLYLLHSAHQSRFRTDGISGKAKREGRVCACRSLEVTFNFATTRRATLASHTISRPARQIHGVVVVVRG